MRAMQSMDDNTHMAEGPALVLVADPTPWYAPTPASAPGRRELEDEHTRILAQAVGDHLPIELAPRAAELAAQLRRAA